MWSVAGILIAGGCIALIEAPGLARKGRWRELFVFFVVLSIGVAVSTLQALHVALPNPVDWITAIHKPISDALLGPSK
ncbi:hypothetical protein FE782_20890 [Paenibacillus antri]|uniref:Uncharacterized protein n=1 Tax=Paenibacillus antri TaxID=2582848 RepID=A0A5R9GGE4_9BACL|nr:hypothetical protein [Paenibacillus antri]TLS50475.1 hypothetical protein FE782_20890 [Paenibacillus antri]